MRLKVLDSHRIVLAGQDWIHANIVEARGGEEAKWHSFSRLIEAEAETDTSISYQTTIVVGSLVIMMRGMCGARAVEWGPVAGVLEKSARWGDAAVIVGRGATRVVMVVRRLARRLGRGVEKR